MEHNKIIKDERGTIRIQVRFVSFYPYSRDSNGNLFRYDVCVLHTLPRKRTEKVNYNIATDAEILTAKIELHELIKPQ